MERNFNNTCSSPSWKSSLICCRKVGFKGQLTTAIFYWHDFDNKKQDLDEIIALLQGCTSWLNNNLPIRRLENKIQRPNIIAGHSVLLHLLLQKMAADSELRWNHTPIFW